MQLVVGRIGRAHGIQGEVTVEVRTDEPELRLAPGAVLATDPAGRGPLTIADGRVHSGRLLLRFEGVADRTAAEALRNTLLVAEIDPEELPDDPEEFYDHQLVGLDVVTVDGEPVGEVREVLHLPSQDLIAVDPGGRFRGIRGEILIPFVTEIVPEVDLEEQKLVVDPPPGLLDDADAVTASAPEGAEASEAAGAAEETGADGDPRTDGAG
ncbi:ribosome maturation factor RimM [Mangrovactinospora gilvigrisea]|uniref:Ribosome maturation factor RimM n=1 Tax=Mangrovactinospora gilvigrisea TaxID=1428644 RepID=A0A1J7BTE5_9ACTN|nr:ribosome maturation factor RimM [Mangrovactinospora gilvigrisea]OIV36729.1 ribosome maturation factor RimM [Mangrovactinospora gilvigrisea]